MLLCPDASCNQAFSDGSALLYHIRIFHPDYVARKRYKCSGDECGREFTIFKSFTKHLKSHKACAFSDSEKGLFDVPSTSPNIADCKPSDAEQTENDCFNVPVNNFPEQLNSVEFDRALCNAVVMFIASLYDCNSFTETQIQQIIDMHKQLLGSGFLSVLKGNVLNLLSKASQSENISPQEIQEVSRMMDSCVNMYEGFDSTHKRLKEFENSGSYIAPESFYIGHGTEYQLIGGENVLVPIELTGQFVSMQKTLKGYLELPGVYETLLSYKLKLEETHDGVLRNVVQGNLWQEIILPKFVDKTVFPLILYFDDYETNKDVGPHTGIHKLGAAYYRIACLPPQFHGTLENIFTAAVFHSTDRAFGNAKVFRTVVNELKVLEEKGITIVTSNGIFNVHFALVLVSGDNLGTNGILGFVECFVANSYCRICKGDRVTNYSQTVSDPSKLRTMENYAQDVKTKNSTLTGVKAECIFNELSSFHVVRNRYIDIMHDLDEGVWKYDMKLIIEYFLSKKRFDLECLNNLIQGFYYGPSEEKNKPPIITVDHIKKDRLPFTASEMKCLIRYFGLMIGHLVTNDDMDVWELWQTARKINDLVTAPEFPLSSLPMLKALTTQHNTLFQELFNGHLYPKMHFMLHLHEVIPDIGPLDEISCMRMEAKHKEGRQTARQSNSRVNLPLTVVKRQQLRFCYRLLVGRGLEVTVESSAPKLIPVSAVKDFEKFAMSLSPDMREQKWNVVKWVCVTGVKYCPGMIVCTQISSYGSLPKFGKIHTITLSKGSVHFLVQIYHTSSFCSKVHAYQVNITDEWLYVYLQDLALYAPTELRQQKFVSFRNAV